MMQYKTLKREFKSATISGWDSAMGMWFDISTELYLRNENIPDHWEFRPGAGKLEREDSYVADLVKDSSTNALIRLGNLLERYTRIVGKHE